MDCTTLCLLAISVGLTASSDTKKCSYCMDVRALSPECDAEPLRCAFTDPSALVYCLTVVEQPREPIAPIRRAVRCVSHAAFNLTRGEFRAAAQLRECAFDELHECDCPNCRPAGGERDYGNIAITTTTTTTHSTTTTTTTTSSSMLLKIHRTFNSTGRLVNMSHSVVPSLRALEVKSLTNGAYRHLFICTDRHFFGILSMFLYTYLFCGFNEFIYNFYNL